MLIWYVAGAVAAIAVGWLASLVHAAGHAPIGIVPVVVGTVLGALLIGLAWLQRLPPVKHIVLSTLALAVLTVVAEHAWLYADYRRQWHADLAKAPRFSEVQAEVPSLVEYFAHELTPGRGVLWCVDAVLIVAAAIVTTWYLERRRQEPAIRALPPQKS
jgi:hypothetical protein